MNTAIKKALCRDAGHDRAWLGKVQPWLGHDWHFHVRLNCPVDSPQCEPQPPRSVGDGCTGSEMHRFSSDALPDAIPPRAGPKMAELPAACRAVLDAAALIGTRVELALLELVAGCSPSAIDELLASGLLNGDGPALGFDLGPGDGLLR